MTTSKGTIQGYNGVASVDKKHQIIIDAQAFGSGQEQHTLTPILESIQDRYARLGISENLYEDDIIVTADTGFANESNMAYLHANNINGVIPDNAFRSRDRDSKSKRKSMENAIKIKSKPMRQNFFEPMNLITIQPNKHALARWAMKCG